jgi:hypothetical protein
MKVSVGEQDRGRTGGARSHQTRTENEKKQAMKREDRQKKEERKERRKEQKERGEEVLNLRVAAEELTE